MTWLVRSVWIRACIHVNPKCWITWMSKHARQEKNGQLCVECTSGLGSQLTCVQYSIGEFEGRVCIWTYHKSEELLKECTREHVQNYITLLFLIPYWQSCWIGFGLPACQHSAASTNTKLIRLPWLDLHSTYNYCKCWFYFWLAFLLIHLHICSSRWSLGYSPAFTYSRWTRVL